MKTIFFKITLISYGLLIALLDTKAQGPINLVPNPGFELIDSCPQAADKVKLLQKWFAASYSPDLYAQCSFNNDVKVPKNLLGYQKNVSSTGQNYIGLHGGGSGGFSALRELAGVKLTDSLIIGQKYYFTMNISLADTSRDGIDHMGMKLTCQLPAADVSGDRDQLIDNNSKVYSSMIDTNKVTWKRIRGFFVSDSNYKYLFVGNFFDQANTNFQTIYPFGSYFGSYYYIDDVCLSTDSNLCYTFITSITNIKPDSQFFLFPNPASDLIHITSKVPFTTFEIKNSSGILIESGVIEKLKTIHVDKLQCGLYFVEIKNNDTVSRYKLIINH